MAQDYTKTGGGGGKGNVGPVFTGMDNKAVAGDITGTVADGSDALAKVVVKETFDRVIAWKARVEPMYRSFASITPGNLVHAGTGVDMFRHFDDLDPVTAPLAEYADPDAVPLKAPEKVTLVANEYGNATVTTLRLRENSWADIDPIQIEAVARNMRDSIDKIYEKAIYANAGGFPSSGGVTAGTGGGSGFLQFTPGATGSALGTPTLASPGAAAATLNAGHVRRIVAHLRNRNVLPYSNGLYLGLITPDVAVGLREETAVTGWRYPHLDGSQSGPIWNNTVGVFEGVQFLEGIKYGGLKADGTDMPATDVNLLFMGQGALAETVIREPGAVVMPQVDRFNRYMGIGWYAFLGAGIYDADAAVKVAVKKA